MISDFEKKNDGDDSKSNSEKITLSATDLSKKPIGVRRKLKAAAEEKTGDSQFKSRKVTSQQNLSAQKSKLKTKNSIPLPWKKQSNVGNTSSEQYTFGPPPKATKKLKQRRSASQKNMRCESLGEQ